MNWPYACEELPEKSLMETLAQLPEPVCPRRLSAGADQQNWSKEE